MKIVRVLSVLALLARVLGRPIVYIWMVMCSKIVVRQDTSDRSLAARLQWLFHSGKTSGIDGPRSISPLVPEEQRWRAGRSRRSGSGAGGTT